MTRITDAAVVAAAEALLAAGFVDPDDGTIPKWLSDGNPIPVWTHPSEAVKVALAAALPHLEGATPAIDRRRVEQVLRDRLVDSNFNDNLHEPMRTQTIDTWVDVLAGALFSAGLLHEAGPVVPDHVHCDHDDTRPDDYGATRCTHCGLVF